MATTAQYVATPIVGIASISAANTGRDGSGTITTVATGAATGTRIDRISITAAGTTTAGMIRLYVSDTTAANTTANTHLWYEIPVTAITPSATLAAFSKYLATPNNTDILPLILPNGYTLRVSTNNAEAFRVVAYGGNY